MARDGLLSVLHNASSGLLSLPSHKDWQSWIRNRMGNLSLSHAATPLFRDAHFAWDAAMRMQAYACPHYMRLLKLKTGRLALYWKVVMAFGDGIRIPYRYHCPRCSVAFAGA